MFSRSRGLHLSWRPWKHRVYLVCWVPLSILLGSCTDWFGLLGFTLSFLGLGPETLHSHCLFWVLAEKLFICIVFFGLPCINPIFAWSLACFDFVGQLSLYTSGAYCPLCWPLLRLTPCIAHVCQQYVTWISTWCRIQNLKETRGDRSDPHVLA